MTKLPQTCYGELTPYTLNSTQLESIDKR